MTPFDWQEGIGHRAQFVEGRLKAGIPAIAASVPEGILLASYRSHTPKIYEIYDRLAFSALGLQSDAEAIRVAAVEFCHQEGFRRSEEDVTINRLVTQLSQPVKEAFGDFRRSPLVVKGLFAEVNATVDDDRFCILDFDGDYRFFHNFAILAGSREAAQTMIKAVEGVDFSTAKTADALAQMREAVLKGMDPTGELAADGKLLELTFSAAVMLRDDSRARRFKFLEDGQD